MKYKKGDKVLFNTTPLINYSDVVVGSNKAIGIIKDFDGDFSIIETGTGEHYININKIVRVLK